MSTAAHDRIAARPTAGTWTLDTAHSAVEVVARHLMVSKVRGRFASVTGTVEVAEDVAQSRVSVEIDAASISTNDPKRDGHLVSDDFLAVESHPTITFTADRAVHVDGDHWKLPGRLTIRGVTRDVELDVTYHGLHPDPWGNTHAAFSATAEVDREDFGITWNQALETGGVLVSRRLEVELEVQLVPAG
jgi:polyisoprenoid-binding protein YceI